MDDFEQQLKHAMARKEAPAWLEAKVLAEVRRREQPARRWSVRWAAAALATVLVSSGVLWQHERDVRDRAAGEAAKAKLELALRITRTKLQQIDRQVTAVQERN